MNIGQTVFYAISEKDADRVNKRRRDAMNSGYLVDGTGAGSGAVMHFGNELTPGMLLPAEVVACYTVEEAVLRLHPDDAENLYDPEDRRHPHITFSGFADLRVKLPGNDTLWLPWAQQDRNCKAVQGRGHGVTSTPRKGLFTVSAPAELL